MFLFNYIESLLGIKDAEINDVITLGDSTVEVHFGLRRHPCECPACHSMSGRVHDYRTQVVKGAPIGARHLQLHYRKRRYVCPDCGKRFYEPNGFVPRYHRMSSELVAFVIRELASTVSMKSVASRCNISATTVARLMGYLAVGQRRLPEVLSIDEFRGNAETGKFQCILTDPERHQVVDILPGRESRHITSYFSGFSREERNQVKVVVMDMCQAYKSIAKAYFKNAIIVADRFHYVRLMMFSFDRIRRDEQSLFAVNRRRYFKRSRKLLSKRFSQLSKENQDAVAVMLSLSHRLAKAHFLKEKFLYFVDSSSFEEAKQRLTEWYMHVASCDLPEFNRCMETIVAWQDEVLNSFKVRYTNGYTEGVNNKIKVLKRVAYGVKNFVRFRQRILHMMSA